MFFLFLWWWCCTDKSSEGNRKWFQHRPNLKLKQLHHRNLHIRVALTWIVSPINGARLCRAWELLYISLSVIFTRKKHERQKPLQRLRLVIISVCLPMTLFALFFFFNFSFLSAVSCYCLLLQWSIKFNFLWLISTHTSSLLKSLSECRRSCYRARVGVKEI